MMGFESQLGPCVREATNPDPMRTDNWNESSKTRRRQKLTRIPLGGRGSLAVGCPPVARSASPLRMRKTILKNLDSTQVVPVLV